MSPKIAAQPITQPKTLTTRLEKKAEWNAKKAVVKVALAKGERPSAMPFRERLLYESGLGRRGR